MGEKTKNKREPPRGKNRGQSVESDRTSGPTNKTEEPQGEAFAVSEETATGPVKKQALAETAKRAKPIGRTLRETQRPAKEGKSEARKRAKPKVEAGTAPKKPSGRSGVAPEGALLGPTASVERHQGVPSLMPQSDESRRILLERAVALAQQEETDDGEANRRGFLRFRLGASEQYGIPSEFADEIFVPAEITKVPCTPPWIAGVINHYGSLLTILDLKHFFRTQDRAYATTGQVIVVSGSGMTLGILTDGIEGEDQYDPAQLAEPLPSDGVVDLKHIKGIHQGRITLVDMDALLGDPNLVVTI